MSWLREVDRWFIDEVLPNGPAFLKAAARVVGTEAAEDVVQEAYARLLGYPAWRDITSARAFCLTVIRNIALERLRRTAIVSIDQVASLDMLQLADERPDAFRQAAAKIELSRLLGWIDELPPQCGRVVRMRKLDGLPPREIAVLLGISVSTVETHLAKGLARLIERMRDIETKGMSWPKTWVRRRRRG